MPAFIKKYRSGLHWRCGFGAVGSQSFFHLGLRIFHCLTRIYINFRSKHRGLKWGFPTIESDSILLGGIPTSRTPPVNGTIVGSITVQRKSVTLSFLTTCWSRVHLVGSPTSQHKRGRRYLQIPTCL